MTFLIYRATKYHRYPYEYTVGNLYSFRQFLHIETWDVNSGRKLGSVIPSGEGPIWKIEVPDGSELVKTKDSSTVLRVGDRHYTAGELLQASILKSEGFSHERCSQPTFDERIY